MTYEHPASLEVCEADFILPQQRRQTHYSVLPAPCDLVPPPPPPSPASLLDQILILHD